MNVIVPSQIPGSEISDDEPETHVVRGVQDLSNDRRPYKLHTYVYLQYRLSSVDLAVRSTGGSCIVNRNFVSSPGPCV
jgi:hypothetical protein